MDFNAFMNQISGGGGGMDQPIDVDDDLDALEKEIKKENKGGKRKTSDDDLAALEAEDSGGNASDKELDALDKEDLDDVDLGSDDKDMDDEDDKNKKKPVKASPAPQKKAPTQVNAGLAPPIKAAAKNIPAKNIPAKNVPAKNVPAKNVPAKNIPAKNIAAKIEDDEDEPVEDDSHKNDIYRERHENKYHSEKTLKSISVLQNELQLCDKIIKYKQDNNYDDDDVWDNKKLLVNCEKTKIESLIMKGKLTQEYYIKLIQSEKDFEFKLLKLANEDKELFPEEKTEIIRRINERISLIDGEIKEANEENEEGGEVKEAQEQQKEGTADIQTSQGEPTKDVSGSQTTQEESNASKIEETKEDKKTSNANSMVTVELEDEYHNLKAMKSKNVLENEVKVCDLIINYKKKQNPDEVNIWEKKKEEASTLKQRLQKFLDDKKIDVKRYNTIISSELTKEKELLEKANNLKDIDDNQKKFCVKRIKDRISIIEKELVENSKEENTKSHEEPKEAEKKEEPQNNKLLNKAHERLNEYNSAVTYFKANNLTTNIEEATETCKKIIEFIKKAQSNDDTISEADLPKPITPEFVCGMTKEEKLAKLKTCLESVNKLKVEAENEYNKIAEKSKSLNPSLKKRFLNDTKSMIDKCQATIALSKKNMAKIHETAKNPFIPPPECGMQPEQYQVPKINDKVPENSIIVCFEKTNYIKKHLSIEVMLYKDANTPEPKYKQSITAQNDSFHKPFVWTFEPSDFKGLHRKLIKVEIFRKKYFSWDKKAENVFKLSSLKSKSTITDKIVFQLESKRIEPFIEYNIIAHNACVDKEMETKTREVFKIQKFYPEFKITQAVSTGEKLAQTSAPAKAPQKTAQPATKKQDTTKPANQGQKLIDKSSNESKPEIKLKAPAKHIDKSNFSAEELQDPDYIEGLNSVSVLGAKIKVLEEKINKIEGRTPRELRQKLITMKSRKGGLESQLGDGIDTQTYAMMVGKMYTHFSLLFKYFMQEKQADKAGMVKTTLIALQSEIKELTSMGVQVPVTEEVPSGKSEEPEEEAEPPKKQEPKPAPKATSKHQEAPKAQPISEPKSDKPPAKHIDKSNFSAEELQDPDCVEGLNSVSVLGAKIKVLEEKISKIEGRTPRDLRTKLISMKSRKGALESQLGDGIDTQTYAMMVGKMYTHFSLLFKYFMQEKQADKAGLVKTTLIALQSEIKELTSMGVQVPVTEEVSSGKSEEPKEEAKPPKKQEPKPEPKATQKSQPKATSKPQAKAAPKAQPTSEPKSDKPPAQHIDKSNFSAEELQDPDYVEGLNSVSVLGAKIKILEEKISKIEGRTPRDLRQKLITMKSRKGALESQLGDGIDIPTYTMMVDKMLGHFSLLFKYFMQEKQTDKAGMVKTTLIALQNEKKELATMQ